MKPKNCKTLKSKKGVKVHPVEFPSNMLDLFLAYCTVVLWLFCQKQTPKTSLTYNLFQEKN